MTLFLSVHLPSFILQAIIFIIYFHRMHPVGNIPLLRKILIFCLLALLIPLYTSVVSQIDYNLRTTCIRFFYRAFCYALFLKCNKKCSWYTAIYAAVFFTCIYTVCQTFFQVPVLFEDPSSFWQSVSKSILYIPIFAICYMLIPEEHFYHITVYRTIMLSAVTVCLLYTKTTLYMSNYLGKLPTEYLSITLILLHVFLLAFLAAFERYTYTTKELEQTRVQEIINQYRL